MSTILLNRENNLCILTYRFPKNLLLREAVVFSLSEHASYVLDEGLSMKEGVNCVSIGKSRYPLQCYLSCCRLGLRSNDSVNLLYELLNLCDCIGLKISWLGSKRTSVRPSCQGYPDGARSHTKSLETTCHFKNLSLQCTLYLLTSFILIYKEWEVCCITIFAPVYVCLYMWVW
jgi:hypothetical protein